MVYIMNTRTKPGRPSAQYVLTVRTGYIDNNLDLGYLKGSLLKNDVECDKKDAQFS